MPAGADPGGVWGTFVPHFQWADGKRAFPGRGPEQPTGRYLAQGVQGPREPTEGIPKGPQALWSCGRRVEIGGGFSVPFWRQKGTPVSSLQKADTFPGYAKKENRGARPFHPPRFFYRRGAWGCLCFLKSSGFAAFDRPQAAEKPPLVRSGGNPAALILRFAPGASGFLFRPHSDAADPRHKAERRLENDAKRTQRAARQTVGRTHHFLNASWDRKRAGRRKVCAIGVRWAVSGSVAFRKWFLPCVRDSFTHTGFPHLVRRM